MELQYFLRRCALVFVVGGLLASCETVPPPETERDSASAAPSALTSRSIGVEPARPHRGDTPPSGLALKIAYPDPEPVRSTPPIVEKTPAVSKGEPTAKRRLPNRVKRQNTKSKSKLLRVRTTAYCRDEGDHFSFGSMSAAGKPLRLGAVRSAAADWSRFPAGTQFRIKGDADSIYEIDDYGSALVGSDTIDLYQPNEIAMEHWGVRHVDIEVLRWGAPSRSLQILRPRAGQAHIDSMIRNLERPERVLGGSHGG